MYRASLDQAQGASINFAFLLFFFHFYLIAVAARSLIVCVCVWLMAYIYLPLWSCEVDVLYHASFPHARLSCVFYTG
jgi:hypothetical protein